MENKPIPVNDIKPNDWNPNQMSDEQFKELVREVKHLGKPPKPIILRKKEEFYQIVDGEHNYKALIELGITELQEGWYEIADYNDLEAKRQTWKRNLGGKNNAVKTGLMFAKALEESKISNRQLAEKMDISEATIRTYLSYAEASKLRGDHANLARLTNDQIKLYLNIASYSKAIADFWLYCGALDDALVWFDDKSFKAEKPEITNFLGYLQHTFKDIIEEGFDKKLSYKEDFIPFKLSDEERLNHIQKFKNGIKRANKLVHLKKRMRVYYIWDEGITQETIDDYFDAYFNNPFFINNPNKYWIDNFFSIVVKKVEDKLKFLLTPAELKQCIDSGSGKDTSIITNQAKLIIAKKYGIAPSELKSDNVGLEQQLDAIEIGKNAPDYIKQAKRPITDRFKVAFLDLKFENEELRRAHWEILSKRWMTSDFKDVDESDRYAIKRKMIEISNALERKRQEEAKIDELRQKSEVELAELFIEKVKKAFHTDEKAKKEMTEKLTNDFTKEFLYLLVYLSEKYYVEQEWQERYKALVTSMRAEIERTKLSSVKKQEGGRNHEKNTI